MDICKNMESLIMKNCYGIDFRSWRKELRTREKTKQTPCKLPDRVSRSLQGVLFKVYQISVLILLKKILFSLSSSLYSPHSRYAPQKNILKDNADSY